jgi:hypothetical protein
MNDEARSVLTIRYTNGNEQKFELADEQDTLTRCEPCSGSTECKPATA